LAEKREKNVRVSREWLSEFINLKETGAELAAALTAAGVEVAGVERAGRGVTNVRVGELITCRPHPQAENLRVCLVSVGNGPNVQVVTGAMNVTAGDKAAVALPGALLANGQKVETAVLRGEISAGMLCSEKELGLENAGLERSRDGVLILPLSAPIGVTMEDYFGLDDEILDLDLYPNRPDCLAMVGVARELGALLGRRPALSGWALGEEKTWPESEQRVSVEAPELCHRYAGLVTADVTIAPSPQWMQNRLLKAGIRPISNVVDITNYCMLELGQPLHAFDADKVRGNIRVRLAAPGETLATLDGVTRRLFPDMLVIADDSGPIAIAGVMGGLATEITRETKNIFFESAHFLGASVRRTSRRLGLHSESSNRFEKGVAPHLCLSVLGRVAELVSELAIGYPVALAEQKSALPAPPRVMLTEANLSRITGAAYTRAETERVLRDSQFTYAAAPEGFIVDIPTYRQDLHIEEDLIEEIARIIGYDRIPTTLPRGETRLGRRTPQQNFRLLTRDTLVGNGFAETVAYSFVSPAEDALWGGGRQIALRNSLRDELSVMRTSLLPSLLEAGARNAARRNTDWLLFEMGSVYLTEEDELTKLPQEAPRLAGIMHGGSGRHWRDPIRPYDFYYGKGVLDALARACRTVFRYERLTEPRYADLLHPGRAALVRVGDERLGVLGELYPSLAAAHGLQRPVVFELDMDALYRRARQKFTVKGYPRFPGMSRDLAVVVEEEVAAEDILRRIRELGSPLLREAGVFDLYRGAPVPADRKSLAFRLRYQSAERTLTEEETGRLTAEILTEIEKEFGAARRQ
jgi:phenylalanyl-tRNA synthetase beta chain